tara:strand:+ start:100575 stop:102143 length:1569 start_codon:yes stop_codon:yes gene_type:complete
MDNRTYNIFFHTHTISGIIISAVLYVLFFTGSLSFFRDEIINWERNESVYKKIAPGHLDIALDSIANTYDLYGRDISINWPSAERRMNVSLGSSKDTLATDAQKAGAFFYMDTETHQNFTYVDSYSLGEFLYRLHFLAQIPYPIGYYLSGFIAFFFLFAIITGILVHWDKIVQNFYVFRPMAKLKTLWTDAHTGLGVIGLPFQFVYAVTGAFFMIKLVVVAPAVMVLYEGDQVKLYDELEYNPPTYAMQHQRSEALASVDGLVAMTTAQWDDFQPTRVQLLNYGDQSMKVLVEGETAYSSQFTGTGKILYDGVTGNLISKKDPYVETTYLDVVKNLLYRLHFGDYGGYALKLISLLLGLISCFVIISGVMIWLVARDKKHISETKRTFNRILVRLYLASCLGMYPLTALTFIMVKVLGRSGMDFLYPFYFWGWLLLTILLMLKKSNGFIIRFTLLWGSILALFVPMANGIQSGNWFWKTFAAGQLDIFIVDAIWIGLAITGFFIYAHIVKKEKRLPVASAYL